ncbi:hypothetical protein HY498_03960 [Candidatus Woesearchaeota archaeon]|nr:hypothetical protein [Candidatus Woesearchaeota archaeon]
MFEVKNHFGWQYICLSTDSRLGTESIDEIVSKALDMHLEGKNKVRLKGENYEGEIRDTKKYFTVGIFGGHYLEGIVEYECGKKDLAFLVWERINHELN